MSLPAPRERAGFASRLSLFTLVSCVLCLAFAAGVLVGCDRNIEDYDPNESAREPDLSRIFPAPEEAMQPRAGQMGGPSAGDRGNLPPSRTEPGGTAAMADAGSASAAGGDSIRGRIVTAPGLEGAGGGILFLIARPYGAAGGPPMAVVRVPSPQLPFEFEIGQANVMIPSMKFAGQIQLEARLDGDGNAMTREAGDLVADVVGPLEPGTSGVEVVLSRKL